MSEESNDFGGKQRTTDQMKVARFDKVINRLFLPFYRDIELFFQTSTQLNKVHWLMKNISPLAE